MADQIEISVTHQITIDGDPSWIKLGYHTDIRDNESEQQAIARGSILVNQQILEVIEETVSTIRSAT